MDYMRIYITLTYFWHYLCKHGALPRQGVTCHSQEAERSSVTGLH